MIRRVGCYAEDGSAQVAPVTLVTDALTTSGSMTWFPDVLWMAPMWFLLSLGVDLQYI